MPAGRDAVLRCESHVPDVAFELLRAGEEEPSVTFRTAGNSADLVLEFVGPQHAGNYSCRYHPWGAGSFPSGLSDPVELLVAGKHRAGGPRGTRGGEAGHLPRPFLPQGCPGQGPRPGSCLTSRVLLPRTLIPLWTHFPPDPVLGPRIRI